MVSYDPSYMKPGVVFSFTMTCGQRVQVLSDGSVLQTSGNLMTLETGGCTGQPRAQLSPGCPEDFEVERRVTPLGSVVRKLLSGRLELYHPDGTTCIRNPKVSELTHTVESCKAGTA